MGYTRVQLDDIDFTRTIVEAIPKVRIEDNVEFKWSKKKKEKTRFLAGLVIRSINGTSRHKDGGNDQDSFSAIELKRGLGKDYKKFLKPLYRFIDENLGYSSTGHSTKMYGLRASVRKRARSALRNYDGSERVVDDKGKEIFKHKWPKNGNQCKKSEIKVPALIPIDLDTLNETIESLEEVEQKERDSGNARPSITDDIDRLCNIRRWVRAAGGVPNFYKEESTGRLGSLGQFHIIRISNLRRMLLFRTKGWCDFDFRNCHYAIFRSLCSHHGLQTPCVDEFLEDHRTKLMELLWSTRKIPPSDTKKTFLAFLYGAGLVPHHSTTVTKNFGYAVVEVLRGEPWFGDFVKEIKTGRDLILDDPRVQKHTSKSVTTNIVGKGTTESKKGSRFSHILIGYERWCLETVCRDFEDTKCLIYYGWISPDRDVKELEQSIVERSTAEFGFPIDLKIKTDRIPDSVDEILDLAGAK